MKNKNKAPHLSQSQSKVLKILKDRFYETGSMPTLREICKEMNWSAVGSAQSAVQGLIDAGQLQRDPQKARGLRLTNAAGARAVPILGSAPAGIPLEAIESHDQDIAIPDFIHGPVFAIRVEGDSMQGVGIYDHDIVIVRQTSEARSGEIILALVDGETTIKTLVKKGRAIWLYPENKRFKAKKVETDNFKILGKVVGLHRYW